jgi:hypothetical protein
VRALATIVAAVAVAAVPAAQARGPVAKCGSHGRVAGKVKPGGGCRTLGGVRPAAAAGVPMAPAGIRGPVVAPPVETPPVEIPVSTVPGARLGVTAREWSLALSRGALPAGRAIVQLQNLGEDAHNLRVERVDGTASPLNVPLAESGEVKQGEATLTAGAYKVYCALPGHDAAGMHARLTVTP